MIFLVYRCGSANPSAALENRTILTIRPPTRNLQDEIEPRVKDKGNQSTSAFDTILKSLRFIRRLEANANPSPPTLSNLNH
jgi:hypothetical protein